MPRIMLVDDDELILRSLTRALSCIEYDIEVYTCAEAALKRAQAGEFALVLSDYRMPAMDGVTFLKILKKQQPDTVRMILSAYTDLNALLSSINEAEIFRFITKPWQDYDLRTTVSHALSHRKVLLENRRLADQVRKQQDEINEQYKALQELEIMYPGITEVRRAKDGSILLEEDDL